MTNRFIDKNTVEQLRKLSTREVAIRLGFEVKNRVTRCFAHPDNTPSLNFYGPNHCKWHCYSCNKTGSNAISFVQEVMHLGFVDACHYLLEMYNEGNSVQQVVPVVQSQMPPPTGPNQKEFHPEIAKFILKHSTGMTPRAIKFLIEERKLKGKSVLATGLRSIETPWELAHLLTRYFDMETLSRSRFVKVTNGKVYLKPYSPCLLFPYYDTEGNIVGIQSRYLGTDKEVPRFQFFFKNGARLFNQPILKELQPGDDLYISEGLTDCLAMLSNGLKAVAIPSSSVIPRQDLNLLKPYRLHYYPDNDEAGRRGAENLTAELKKIGCNLIIEQLPEGKNDYSSILIKKNEKSVN